MDQFMASDIFKWIILPLLIILARMTDVSLGTLRIIFISRGFKLLATMVGFFEVIIWLLAITQIMKNLNNVFYYLAYAGGFSLGTFLGMLTESKLAMGKALIRIIIPDSDAQIISRLKAAGCGLTYFPAHGAVNPVKVVFTLVNRKDIPCFLNILKETSPEAVYSIEDIRTISKTPSSLMAPAGKKGHGLFKTARKGK